MSKNGNRHGYKRWSKPQGADKRRKELDARDARRLAELEKRKQEKGDEQA